jgi:hypothetical protein
VETENNFSCTASCARVSVEHRYPHREKTHRFKSGDKGLMNKRSASRAILQAHDRQELVHWCVVACSAEQMVGVTGATTFAIQAAWFTDEVKTTNGSLEATSKSFQRKQQWGSEKWGVNVWQIVTVFRACSAVASDILPVLTFSFRSLFAGCDSACMVQQ